MVRLFDVVTICINVSIAVRVCVSNVVVRVDLHVIGIFSVEVGALGNWGRCQGGVRRRGVEVVA